MASRERLEQIFATTVDPDSVAAIIMELELGEGGFVPAPSEYVDALAEFARDHGILFIADEIQTGFGRTGKLFASEHYGLVPDLIITAKSLAGGLPLAAVTGTRRRPGRPPAWAASAAPTVETRSPAPPPWRCSMSWRRSGSRPAPREWGTDQGPVLPVGGSPYLHRRCPGARAPWSAWSWFTDRQSKTPDKALTGRLLAAALRTRADPALGRNLRKYGADVLARSRHPTRSWTRDSTLSNRRSNAGRWSAPPGDKDLLVTASPKDNRVVQFAARLQELRGRQGGGRHLLRHPAG